ncbi:MAG: T9SS type A sorting domain-containing protein [Bacteroidales bacterium]|nr:T9SS type A sorting domain-containing protein [Bacteroidales bacterium]
MKTQIILAAALMASSMAQSQPDTYDHHRWKHRHHNMNDEKVQRLDSVIGFVREVQTDKDVQDYVFIYKYDKGKDDPREVVKLDLPERVNSNRQLYPYTRDGFKARYIYQEWIADNWKDRMLVEYFPDDDDKLAREQFSALDETGAWVPYQKHFYSYDYLGRISLYLRKMSDWNGGWYDFSENIWTFNDSDQLLQRVEKRVADDYVIWTETYYYGDGVKPTERIRQTMRYDPVAGYNTLTNDTRQLYFYDEFNDPRVMEQYKWMNNEWVYVGQSQYYYSFIPGRKVTLCHNGHSISVAPQAVRAHLAHGDRLGPCVDECKMDDGQPEGIVSEEVKYAKVFPNPASGQFELALRTGHGFRTAQLISGDGRVVRSEDIRSLERVVFEVSRLRSGQYILKLQGGSAPEDIMVIIR